MPPEAQSLRSIIRLTLSAPSVQAAPESRYRLTENRPNWVDRPRATNGANAAPTIQATSAVRAAPV